MSFRAALLLAWILLPATPLVAQQLYRLELSGAAGYHSYGSATELDGAVGFGGRLGYWFYGPLSAEVEANFASPRTGTPLRSTVHVSTVAGWLVGNIRLGSYSSVFLKGGYGNTSYGSCPAVAVPGSGPCGSVGVLQGGAGVRFALFPTVQLRVDAALNQSMSARRFSNTLVQGGLSLMLGSRSVADSDHDGVDDRHDRCDGTPSGTLVNPQGCPADRDRDGVADSLDRCPGTPQGALVDAIGCTSDSDGDAYLDGIDACPDTPAGAQVDTRGCPRDEDGDGVFDGLDRCPRTEAGVKVDSLGCPGDDDGDGVLNGLDRCPNTPASAKVDAEGCPAAPAVPPPDSATSGEKVWRLPGTVWEFRAYTIDSTALPVLDSIVTQLRANPKLVAEVQGYAHDRLVPSDNTRLSQRRADVVRSYIVSKGVTLSRVTAVGRGSQTLLVADTTQAARTANRRVEIRITRVP